MRLIGAMHSVSEAEQAVEDGDSEAEGFGALVAAHEQALEILGDRMQAVQSGVYEFRKRRDRAVPPSTTT